MGSIICDLSTLLVFFSSTNFLYLSVQLVPPFFPSRRNDFDVTRYFLFNLLNSSSHEIWTGRGRFYEPMPAFSVGRQLPFRNSPRRNPAPKSFGVVGIRIIIPFRVSRFWSMSQFRSFSHQKLSLPTTVSCFLLPPCPQMYGSPRTTRCQASAVPRAGYGQE